MMRIVWQMPDGSKRVTTPGAPMLNLESQDAYLDRVAKLTQEALPELKDAVRVANITAAQHAEMRRVRAQAQTRNTSRAEAQRIVDALDDAAIAELKTKLAR